jgi:uncharacterized protein YegL
MAINLSKLPPVNLAKLSSRDLEFLIDGSGSMAMESGRDCEVEVEEKGGLFSKARTVVKKIFRWDFVGPQAAYLAGEAAKVDDDGIYAAVFNERLTPIANANADTVAAVFKRGCPGGGTNTAAALKSRIDAYFQRLAANPNTKDTVIFVVTDGAPTHNLRGQHVSTVEAQKAVADVIVDATKRLTAAGKTRKALGIFFLQVGHDAQATKFLEYLDDNLTSAGATMDIVDTKNASQAKDTSIGELIEGALND